jgi:hypothetical protein
VRDVLDLSASDSLMIPSLPMRVLPVLSEHKMTKSLLQLRSSEVRDLLYLSASDNSMIPSSLI